MLLKVWWTYWRSYKKLQSLLLHKPQEQTFARATSVEISATKVNKSQATKFSKGWVPGL